MIEVNAREFQQKFRNYKNGYDKVKVMGRGGVIGIWTPGAISEVSEEDNDDFVEDRLEKSEKVNVEDTFVKNAAYERLKEVIEPKKSMFRDDEEFEKCKKCGGRAHGSLKYWDELEQEDVTNSFCIKCAKEVGVRLNLFE